MGRYLMVLPVPARALAPGRFAIESAFAEHLRQLRAALGPLAIELVVMGPELSEAQYAEQKGHFAEVVQLEDHIRFRPLFPFKMKRRRYWADLRRVMSIIREEVLLADTVHGGVSELFQPYELPALMLAERLGKRTVSVTDIDMRRTARMKRSTGEWSLARFLWFQSTHGVSWRLQQHYATRHFSLVLLKGQALTRDYGRGRKNVRYFLDSAFSSEHLIPSERLAAKQARAATGAPLRLIYFGRLVAYKGVDRMLRAVGEARRLGVPVELRVIGGGPERSSLEALAAELALGDVVKFEGTVPFGPTLFDAVYAADILLAAPRGEDTPRSALDAAAAGTPIVAFDTYYYRELAEQGCGVVIVPWEDTETMARALRDLHADRKRLVELQGQSARFAGDNTQERWLERRATWTAQAGQASTSGPAQERMS